MELLRNCFKHTYNLVAAIGNFDGMHLGHQKLIDEVMKVASQKEYIPAIITFEPHPTKFFCTDKNNINILSFKTKYKLFKEYGIKKCIILKFNNLVAEKKAEDFFYEIIYKKLNLKHLVVGYNFRFGKGKKGNIMLLQALTTKYNIGFSTVDKVSLKKMVCSSTLIRNLLIQGKIQEINSFLGRNYYIESKIINYTREREALNILIINISIENLLSIKYGVYLTRALIDNLWYDSLAYIGPQVNFHSTSIISVCLLNVDKVFRSKNIKLEFLKFLRSEDKFMNLKLLNEQIN